MLEEAVDAHTPELLGRGMRALTGGEKFYNESSKAGVVVVRPKVKPVTALLCPLVPLVSNFLYYRYWSLVIANQ